MSIRDQLIDKIDLSQSLLFFGGRAFARQERSVIDAGQQHREDGRICRIRCIVPIEQGRTLLDDLLLVDDRQPRNVLEAQRLRFIPGILFDPLA